MVPHRGSLHTSQISHQNFATVSFTYFCHCFLVNYNLLLRSALVSKKWLNDFVCFGNSCLPLKDWPSCACEIISVADAGLLEGGFCYNVVHEACAKILKPHPLSIKPTTDFQSFWRETSCPTGQLIHFRAC